MQDSTNKLSRFWQEMVRRRVIHFLIAYTAACFTIIEFFDITSDRFVIPDNTFKLLYLLAVFGLPVVLLLPWFINRKKEDVHEKILELNLESFVDEKKKIPNNIPAQLTSFIGREQEMQTVTGLISEHRIVSLIGAGGCGKTRLAIEVASQLLPEFKDGVWFVDLSPITDEALVPKEIMEALNISEVHNQPIINTLIDNIKEKNQLIMLDNCEHLVKSSAKVALTLVQSAPELKILATSREPLNITGEKVWRVPSLSLLDPKTIINVDQARDSEAILLFTDRARLNNPEFELVAENVNEVARICNKLDGIPLALELVASRTRHMNAKMILERFSDRFDQLASSDPGASKRQQTLQATIEWSYNLLSEIEKRLFVRLAVFSGGFDIAAAEEVCSDDQLPKESILDLLSMLLDRSLVYIVKGSDQTMRYNRLETLRQFAIQKLQLQKEEDKIRSRHLHFYLGMAEQAYKEQFESEMKGLNKLEEEHDNLIAALNWSYTQSLENFILLSGYLGWFWISRSHLLLGTEYIEKVLTKDVSKSEGYARNLCGLGGILWYTAEHSRALNYFKESLQIWRQRKNLFEEAIVLQNFCKTANVSGDFDVGMKYGLEGLEIAKKVGNPGLINSSLLSVCAALTWSKEYDRAKPMVEELLNSSEELEQPSGILMAHHFDSDAAQGTGNYQDAEKKYGQVISLAIEFGMHHLVGIDMQGVAFALAGQSRWAKSIRLDAASRKIAKQYGVSTEGIAEFWDQWIEKYLMGARKEVGEELSQKYEEEGRAMEFDKAVEYALDLEKD
jgi:predicted ATPase